MATPPDGRLDLIQLRRDVDADWVSVNPILAYGEPGWDANGVLKIGDGVTPWNSLSPAGSSAFAPIADELIIAATSLYTATASAFGFIGATGVWILVDAANSQVHGGVDLPPTWVTYGYEAWWCNSGVGAGNVVFVGIHQNLSSASVLGGIPDLPAPAAALPTATLLKATTIGTGLAVPATTGEIVTFKVARDGAAGGDTLAASIYLAAVRFFKVT